MLKQGGENNGASAESQKLRLTRKAVGNDDISRASEADCADTQGEAGHQEQNRLLR